MSRNSGRLSTGLGAESYSGFVIVSTASKVTNEMFLAASKALSDMVTQEQREEGLLLPEMKEIRRASFVVAKAVAVEARRAGLGRLLDDADLERVIRKAQWEPCYNPYRPGPVGG